MQHPDGAICGHHRLLTEKVETERIPTVWYIEFSNHLVADSIAEATGAKNRTVPLLPQCLPGGLDAGATYVSLMRGIWNGCGESVRIPMR